jgi:micrococcal nuclease
MTRTSPSDIVDIVIILFEIALYVVPIGIAALIAWNVYPKTLHVTRVVDGDSLEVQNGRRQLRVRIKHFDAPEYHQDGGREARAYLVKLLERGRLRMGLSDYDAFNRVLGRCYIGWMPVDWLMIHGGHAWPTSFVGSLISIAPRLRRRGLWAMRRPIHPSVWRQARPQSFKRG